MARVGVSARTIYALARDCGPSCGIVLLLACALVLGIAFDHNKEIAEYKREFLVSQQNHAERNADQIGYNLTVLYQGLRTIARLPGTRSLDRNNGALDASAAHTIQELYNNLYSNIRLSEVYLLPVGFDPDASADVPGVPIAPIVTFDEFIVGQSPVTSALTGDAESIPEVEIYEYRLMREQLRWFQQHYPRESDFKNLDYPALTGPEVITCDNSQMLGHELDDRDRSGIVYSVPFYGTDGALKGMVSGVVLTNVLRGFIANPHYVLRNDVNHYQVTLARDDGSASGSQVGSEAGSEESVYRADVPVNLVDAGGAWRLHVDVPGEEFLSLPQVETANDFARLGQGAVIAITLVLLVMIVKQRQQRLAIQQANNAKSEFLSRMSHELRTPLNAIIGYSEMLMEDAKADGRTEAVPDLKRIHSSGQHLLALINDVLDLSKIESGRMQVLINSINVPALIDDVVSAVTPVVNANANRLDVRIDRAVGEIQSDEIKVRQILLNLLSNSAKFTQRGRIEIAANIDNGGEVPHLVLCVSDTGIGMSEEQLGKIFHAFVQANAAIARDYGGTGLGLAISRRLCEMLGGSITVSSEQGVGSTFRVRLPVTASVSSADARVQAPADATAPRDK